MSWFRPSNPSLSELLLKEPELPREEPREMPRQDVPISGETVLPERDKPTPLQPNKTNATLVLKIVAIGVSALLLSWGAVKLVPTLKLNERASPQPSVSSSGKVSPRQGPVTGAAPVPPVPARTETDAVPPPQSRSNSLCSPADEKAGLCKPQK